MTLALRSDLAIEVRSTLRADGDFGVSAPGVEGRRRLLLDTPWTWLQLVHGSDVVRVDHPGHGAGSTADGAWTAVPGAALAVTTADCAAVVIGVASDRAAAMAVVHAGWRGLIAGVVQRAGELCLAEVPAPHRLVSYCGPCIGPGDYEFSAADLLEMEHRYGPSVVGSTASGAPALDLFAGVSVALAEAGLPVPPIPPSTAGPGYFSHRVRKDVERMTTVARMVSAA